MSATAKRIVMHSVPITPAQPANNTNIPGGFIIKARKIEESEIAHAAPAIREIWDWLLMQCNHKDNPVLNIRRGQCVRKIADIQEGLHWFVGYRKETYSKTQCENALEWLRKRQMITTTKTTRGLIITVCKYDSYNRIENYEYNSEDGKKTTGRQQQGGTINKNGNNANNKESSDTPAKKKKFIPPTLEEVKEYFKSEGYTEESAIKAFKHYNVADWVDSKGNKVKNWRQKMNSVWFKDENKAKEERVINPVDMDEYLGRTLPELPF